MDTRIMNNYIVPNPADRELVILTDKDMSMAVVASRSNTFVASAEATQILHSSFVGAVPTKFLEMTTHHDPDKAEAATFWIRDASEEGLVSLSTTLPTRKVSAPVAIEAGAFISVADFGDGRGIPVEYAGKVIKSQINETTIYWYAAEVSLEEKHSALGISSVGMRGPFGIGILPRPISGSLGVNCNGCKVCAACAGCAACVLCGGLNFAVGSIAVDGVLGTIALADAVGAMGALRTKIK